MMLKINRIATLSRCDLYLTDNVCDWRMSTWWVSGVFSGELNKMFRVQLSYKTHQFGDAGNKLYEFRDSTPLLTLIICKKNNTFIFPMFRNASSQEYGRVSHFSCNACFKLRKCLFQFHRVGLEFHALQFWPMERKHKCWHHLGWPIVDSIK